MEVTPNPHCGARTRAGDSCGNKAGFRTDHVGFGQCYLHGGATETGKKHAKAIRDDAFARILEMTDPALARIRALIDYAESEAVALSAARDILDRAGLGAKHVHEHTGPDGGPIPLDVRAGDLLDRARKLRSPAKAKPATRKKASATGKKASPPARGKAPAPKVDKAAGNIKPA